MEVGGGAGSARLSLSDAVSPSIFASDSDSLSSGGASSRRALCRSSVMLGTRARRHPGRAAQWPRRSAQHAQPLGGPEHLTAPRNLAKPLQPRRQPRTRPRPAPLPPPLPEEQSCCFPKRPLAPPPGKLLASAHAHRRHLVPRSPDAEGGAAGRRWAELVVLIGQKREGAGKKSIDEQMGACAQLVCPRGSAGSKRLLGQDSVSPRSKLASVCCSQESTWEDQVDL